LMAHSRLDREAAQLDPDHEAALPHLADGRQSRDRLEQRREELYLGLKALERLLLLEQAQVGERRRARERVARVGVPVEEGAEVLEAAEEALVDALGRERCRERQVAARE